MALSLRAEELLRPLDSVNGRRLGDTELIDAVRSLLSNPDYVYNSAGHADAVLDTVNYIRALASERRGSINLSCTPEGNTALHTACRLLAAPPSSFSEAFVRNPDNYAKVFRVRNDIVVILLDAGANPFLVNDAGETCIEAAPAGPARESLVTCLVEYRAATEGAVLSVPPLDASRLMKRTSGDSGFATFSRLCKHCIYYLYKGAVYLWDTKADVEHTIYQPRDSDPKIQALEQRMLGFDRRKSMAVLGARAGEGKWTSQSPAQQHRAQEAAGGSRQASGSATPELSVRASTPTATAEEGEGILRSLASLEAKVPFVSNFTLTTGVDVRASENVPESGAVEWLLTNTGVAVGVRLNEKGPLLREGETGVLRRRPSKVLGAIAQYPEGKCLDVTVFHNCVIRFARRQNAANVCCAVDGLRRKAAYVVATRRAKPPGSPHGDGDKATEEICGSFGTFNATNFGNSELGQAPQPTAPATPAAGAGSLAEERARSPPPHLRKRVSFNEGTLAESATHPHHEAHLARDHDAHCHEGAHGFINLKHAHLRPSSGDEQQHSRASTPSQHVHHANDSDRLYVTPEDGVVFRVANICPRNAPSDSFEELIDELCSPSHTDPFSPDGAFAATDFRVPASYGEAVSVAQCGDDIFVLFCERGVIVADATDAVGKPEPVAFTDITPSLRFSGAIVAGRATHPQRFRRIKSGKPPLMFAVRSDTVELCQIERARDGSLAVRHVMVFGPDHSTPHQFAIFFHEARDELVVVFQSEKKTEVCAFDFTTRIFQSVCKLPRPSSLRFYPPKKGTEGELQRRAELPQSVFAVSDAVSPLLIRYNVTMHCMSIYLWEEMLQRQAARKVALVPSVFSRLPIDPYAKSSLQLLMEKVNAPTRSATVIDAMPCAHLVVECALLQRLVRANGLLRRHLVTGDGHQGDPVLRPLEDALDAIAGIIDTTFNRMVAAAGGKPAPFECPPYVFVPAGDVESTEAEVEAERALYYANRPRHEGVWCATFHDIGDAARVAVNLHRTLNKTAEWPAAVLALPGAGLRERPYQPKTALEKRHGDVVTDRDEAPHDDRGPRIRTLVAKDLFAARPRDLLRAHRMATDVTPMYPTPGESVYPAIAQDGIIVVPTAVMAELGPILPLLTTNPPSTERLRPVKPTVEGTTQNPIVEQLTLIAPPEFSARLTGK